MDSTSRLIAPLAEELRRVNRSGSSQERNAKKYIRTDLLNTFLRFADVDGTVSPRAAQFFLQVFGVLDSVSYKNWSTDNAVKFLTGVIKSDSFIKNSQIPWAVTLLEGYDGQHGTNYAADARTLFVDLANTTIFLDNNEASEKDVSDLQRFKAMLSATPNQPNLPSSQEEPLNPVKSVNQRHAQSSARAAHNKPQEVETEPLENLMRELQSLIGLAKIKKDVAELANYIKIEQIRKSRGLKTPELSLHMVFYGNPGTGKTTVARLLAKIYKSLGVVTRGQLVETDRSGLIAGYVGQTALKVKQVVETALGGILFIDEAYALKSKNDSGDFGDEAIETVLKLMEDNRGNLIVVAAGYPNEMRYFLASNPGLESRFNKYLTFEDYSPDELLQIFQKFCIESQYKLDDTAAAKLGMVFKLAFESRDAHFGNARLARNLFEQAITSLATRVVNLVDVEDSALEIIQAADIPDDLTTV